MIQKSSGSCQTIFFFRLPQGGLYDKICQRIFRITETTITKFAKEYFYFDKVVKFVDKKKPLLSEWSFRFVGEQTLINNRVLLFEYLNSLDVV